MKVPKPISLLNTHIHPISQNNVLGFIGETIKNKQRVILFPINVHILVGLANNLALKKRFEQSASIIFCDGIPLIWLSRLQKTPLRGRVSGTDIICALLHKNYRIFLLGSSAQIIHNMLIKYKSADDGGPICGIYSPPFRSNWGNKENEKIIRRINAARADVVLVALGTPKEQQWILNYFPRVNAHAAIGVGSAFDILSGKTPRAPLWMQVVGLEWTWRVLLEPKRLFYRYISDFAGFVSLLTRARTAA